MYCINENYDAYSHCGFFFQFFTFFLLSLLYNTNVQFFLSKDFSATTLVKILKFGTKLDSDEFIV